MNTESSNEFVSVSIDILGSVTGGTGGRSRKKFENGQGKNENGHGKVEDRGGKFQNPLV